MSTLNVTEGLGRTPARPTIRHSGHGIRDLDRAQPRQAIPLAELEDAFAEWTAAVDRAKDAYYGKTKYYAARTAACRGVASYSAITPTDADALTGGRWEQRGGVLVWRVAS